MSRESLLTPAEAEQAAAQLTALQGELNRLLLGRQELHRLVLAGILSQGHLLLEGMPGLGKTALANTLGALLGLEFSRVQFTPDLMPGDILGSHILQQGEDGKRSMEFQAGPVFANILLADEINRASPKTQSALLEAMQERSVTLMGATRPLPRPFFVIASQNPVELEGTYPLPEAQLDRFLFKLDVATPPVETLEAIIGTRRRGELPQPRQIIDSDELGSLFGLLERIVLPKAVGNYVARLVAATHPGPDAPETVRNAVQHGASPRAAIGIAEAARALALMAGRPTVGFEDVAEVAAPVLRHRLILTYQARYEGIGPDEVVTDLLEAVSATKVNLPSDVSIPS